MSDYEGLSRVVIVKKKKNVGLGFKMKNDLERKGNIISHVNEDGPSAAAGLLHGDRLLAVKKTNVEEMPHDDVVAIIKKYIKKDSISFTVVSAEADPINPERDALAVDNGEQIYNVTRTSGSFGFSLSTKPNPAGGYDHELKEIKEGGAASKAGIHEGMILLAMNGLNVAEIDHRSVVKEVKSAGKNVIMRVRLNNSEPNTTVAEIEEEPVATTMPAPVESIAPIVVESAAPVAKLCRVVKSTKDNYGFACKYNKDLNMGTVNRIAIGSPAQLAGLENGDRIFGVNGKNILGMTHNETIALIKQYENHVVFLAVSEKEHENWIAAGRTPEEWEGVPQWKSNYGELGIPRNATLRREEDEKYGFTMEYANNKHVVKSVNDGSPADRAGLLVGDVVCCINKADVTALEHKAALEHVRESPDHVLMTVVDEKASSLYSSQSINITHDYAEELGIYVQPKMPVVSQVRVMPKEVEEVAVVEEVEVVEEERVNRALDVAEDKEVVDGPEDREPIIEHKLAAVAVAKKVVENRSEEEYKPRLVTLVKDQGYGFFLQDQKGHYLNQIAAGEPAHLAGVKDNDRIVEINGKNVETTTHGEVVDMIRESGDQVSFLVVDPETDEYFKSKNVLITSALLANVHNAEPKARLCRLAKQNGTFGFEVHSEKTEEYGNAQFLRNIAERGSAEEAGVLEHDRLIEINGTKTSGLEHTDIVNLIKASGDEIVFLVADDDCSKFYHNKGVVITEEHADALPAPVVVPAVRIMKEKPEEQEEAQVEVEIETESDEDAESKKKELAAAVLVASVVQEKLNDEEEPTESENVVEAVVETETEYVPAVTEEPVPELKAESVTFVLPEEEETEREPIIEHKLAALAVVKAVKESNDDSDHEELEIELQPDIAEAPVEVETVATSDVLNSGSEAEKFELPSEPEVEVEEEEPVIVVPPKVAAAVAASVVTKPINDTTNPEFKRNVSVHDARSQKIFGTVKSFKVHPNAKPTINIYEENAQQLHQATQGIIKDEATISTPAPTPTKRAAPSQPPSMAAAATAGVAVVKVRKPTGASINNLLQRFQQNGQALTGGQLPVNGVAPSQASETEKAAAPAVQIIDKPAVAAAPVAQVSSVPPPVVNLEAINRAAAGQKTNQPVVQPAMIPQQLQQQQPQYGFYQQPYYGQPMYADPYGRAPMQAFPQQFGQPQQFQPMYGQAQPQFQNVQPQQVQFQARFQ